MQMFSGDMHIHAVFLRKGTYTSKSMLDLGHTIDQTLSGLFVVVFLSVGHYPYYEGALILS
jgi:hypothetical protein